MPSAHWIACRLFRFPSRHPATGQPLEVEAEYFPPRGGARDARGLALEPDEPEEIVIRQARAEDGSAIRFGAFEAALEREAWSLLVPDGRVYPGVAGTMGTNRLFTVTHSTPVSSFNDFSR